MYLRFGPDYRLLYYLGGAQSSCKSAAVIIRLFYRRNPFKFLCFRRRIIFGLVSAYPIHIFTPQFSKISFESEHPWPV